MFFSEADDGRYTPRALLFDLEPRCGQPSVKLGPLLAEHSGACSGHTSETEGSPSRVPEHSYQTWNLSHLLRFLHSGQQSPIVFAAVEHLSDHVGAENARANFYVLFLSRVGTNRMQSFVFDAMCYSAPLNWHCLVGVGTQRDQERAQASQCMY